MHKLVLIRHGESTWNLENRFTGWTDVDLTPTGVSQAMSAGKLLKAEGYEFDLAYTSVLIDVCGADEYAAIHAVGAKNVPLADLESRLPAVVKNKALPLVLVCARGSRAQRAAAVAQKLGYTNAQVLAGGLKAWQDAGLPVEKKA